MFSIRLLVVSLTAATCVSQGGWAWAQVSQAYPAKPVRIIVNSTAGGAADLVARPLAAGLEKRLSQTFIVENRPGGNGLIGLLPVAQAAPDGYTLSLSTSAWPVEEVTNKDWPLRFSRDFSPIAIFAGGGTVIIVPTSLGVRSLRELVSYAKAHPGVLNQAVVGGQNAPGDIQLLWRRLGIHDLIVSVPFKGGPDATQAVAQGAAHIWTATIADAIASEKAGRARLLAYTERQRHPSLPNVPTLAESDPALANSEYAYWFLLMGPARLPADIAEKLSTAVRDVTLESDYRARADNLGIRTYFEGPEQARAHVDAELKKLTELAASGILLR